MTHLIVSKIKKKIKGAEDGIKNSPRDGKVKYACAWVKQELEDLLQIIETKQINIMSLISWFYDGQYDKYYVTVDETVVHRCDTKRERDLFIAELKLRHSKVENSEFAKQCEKNK